MQGEKDLVVGDIVYQTALHKLGGIVVWIYLVWSDVED